jgi:hypothetical protein
MSKKRILGTLELQCYGSALNTRFEVDAKNPLTEGIALNLMMSGKGEDDFASFDAIDALHLLAWLEQHREILLEGAMQAMQRKLEYPLEEAAGKLVAELKTYYQQRGQ